MIQPLKRVLSRIAWLAVGTFILPLQAASSSSVDWSVAVLDQVLASVQPGQSAVLIGDMEIPVSYLQRWRGQLAGAPQPHAAFAGSFTPWAGGNVYYAFDASVSALNQKAFLDAAAEWATFANLHFIARSTQANYILVTNNPTLNGGQSAVGMAGGPQLLTLGPTAWSRPVLAHELGHALGMVHEHQRSDRDNFVTILTNNILPGYEANFVVLTSSQNKGPYDFLSVMHYGRTAWSVNDASNTIQTLPAYNQYLDLMGSKFDPGLSLGDRTGIAQVYGAGPATTNIVTNTQDSGPGSLRAALYYGFDHPGTTISFNIPTSDAGFSNGVFNILPTDNLPSLVNATILDGSTEPTNSNPAGPEILLSGALGHTPSVFPSGLFLRGTNNVVRSLIVNGFASSGILIDGVSAVGNTVSGCYLGTDATGTVAVTNTYCPIQIVNGASGNTIGGLTVAARNVISGSAYQGLVIRDSGTRNNVVQGNYIGLNAAGTAALPNAWAGVELFGGASSNVIGGNIAAARNVISGNSLQGVLISSATCFGNSIAGNYIGVNPAGTAALANGWTGAEVYGGAGGTVISGNVLSGNLNYGVLIRSTNALGQTIQGNFIGLNAAGTAAIPNAYAGVALFDATRSVLIGGFQPADRNVISGNANAGIYFANPTTGGNVIAGNYIGVNAAGTAAVPNASGVDLDNGTFSNTIASNLISGNVSQGILLRSAGTANNVIEGNSIGVTPDGNAALGNGWAGIELYTGAQSNLIGGPLASARNVISGNGNQGIALHSTNTAHNIIQGNYVGLNAAGTAALPNSWSGIELSGGPSANLIGGFGGARNFVSGNANYGIDINYNSSGNVVQGNTVGLDGANSSAIPNAWSGMVIFVGSQSNQIGGTSLGAANLISGNIGDGIQLFEADNTNNLIRGNSIFNNGGNGILLYNSANGGIQPPSLTAATVTTNTTVTGSYTGTSGVLYQIDFYSDTAPIFSAEAMTYLGMWTVTGTGSAAAFSVSLGALVPAGRAITATATDPAGNTSQLSFGVAVALTSTANDGISDAWRARFFGGGGTTTNSSSCATCDPDHDGVGNLQEFLAGTNPTNAASALKLTMQNPAPGTNAFTISATPGIVYRALYCDDLAAGGWNTLADQIVATGTNILVADPATTTLSRRFYRAQALW